jgi:hypothetical protein
MPQNNAINNRSSTLTVDSTLTVTAGNITASSGNVVVTAGNVTLPDTNIALTNGVISFGSNRYIHNFGVANFFLGEDCGNGTLTVGSAQGNFCLGYQSLDNLTSGSGNSAIGLQTLASVTSGGRNDAMGYQAGVGISIGTENVCLGFFTGQDITTGSYNTFIGANAGTTTGTGSSSNIYIKHVGASESNTMRIGTTGAGNGEQNRSFIAGIVGATNAGASTVPYIETATGQLATVPGGAVLMNTGTQSLSISSDASATTVNLATGAAAKTVSLGSTNSTSSLALQYGTADFTLASATGTVMSALDTGEITYPLQPSFYAYLAGNASNVTGDGTAYTIAYDTELFDRNSDFNTGTATFTAPVTGLYWFYHNTYTFQLGTLFTILLSEVVTTARTYLTGVGNPGAMMRPAAADLTTVSGVYAQMTAGDTCTIRLTISGSTKTVDVGGTAINSFFCGNLVA